MWRSVRIHSAGLVAFLAASATGPPAIPILVAVAWFAHSRQLTFEDLANDPPRGDYARTTIPRPVLVDFTPLGTSELAIAFREFGEPMRLATAEVSALVRATERAMGAELADQQQWVDARMEEARRFRAWASEHLLAQSVAAYPLAASFAAWISEHSSDRMTQENEGVKSFKDQLSPNDMSTLYRMGVPLSEVEGVLEAASMRAGIRPWEEFPSALIGATDADSRVAQIFQHEI